MKIRIYKNLSNGLLSVMDSTSGLVVGHCEAVTVLDAMFKVSAAGRKRVLQQRAKNVHAFVEGHPYAFVGFTPYKKRESLIERLHSSPVLPSGAEFLASIHYNPYVMSCFQTSLGCPITEVPLCSVSSKRGIIGYDIINSKL